MINKERIALFFALCVFSIFLVITWKYFTDEKEFIGLVQDLSWKTEIDVLRWEAIKGSRWAHDGGAPQNSYDVTKKREFWKTEREPYTVRECGWEINTTGFGSNRKTTTEYECKNVTKYRYYDVYDDKYYYTLNQWKKIHTYREQGNKDSEIIYTNPDVRECVPGLIEHGKDAPFLGCKKASKHRTYVSISISVFEPTKFTNGCNNINIDFYNSLDIEDRVIGKYYPHQNVLNCGSLKNDSIR